MPYHDKFIYFPSIENTLEIQEQQKEEIKTARYFADWFNCNLALTPGAVSYNFSTKRVIPKICEFNEYPIHSEIIAQQINWFIDFEEKYTDKDRDLYLIEYLKKFENETLPNYDIEIIKTIFTNLNLSNYFGETEGVFLKEKINSLIY